jgi:hypothetical protein
MKIKVKRAIREASELHGATATYVSLVDRGANETPFTLIKSAKHGVTAMAIKKRSEAPQTTKKSHKKVTTVPKTEAATEAKSEKAIIKFSFAADNFADEQSVKDWLADSDFAPEELVIKALDGGGFEALDGALVDVTPVRVGKVDLSEDDEDDAGVIAHIGEFIVKADDPDEEDEESDEGEDEEDEGEAESEEKGYGKKKPMPKDEEEASDEDEAKVETKTDAAPSKRSLFIKQAKETVAKFSGWDAFYAKKSTLSAALEAGMQWDSTPPGYYDVQAAFNGVVAAILGEESMPADAKAEGLMKAASDYAEILIGLDSFFDAYVGAGEENIAKTFDKNEDRAKLEKWAKGYALFLSGGEAEHHTKAATKPLQSTATTADTTVAVADIIAKALAPVTDKLEAVTETVEALASRRQTQKSSTPAPKAEAGPAPEKQRKSTQDWLTDKTQRSMFG